MAPAGRPAAAVSPTTSHRGTGSSGQQVGVGGQVVVVAEPVGGHHHVGRGDPQDVVDLLGPVEVHDGDDHRPEVGGRPEGDAGLHPVGQLDDHDRPRARRPGPRSDAASERAARSTSAKVPCHGRLREWTSNTSRPMPARPSATMAPSVASVHQPSAAYRRAWASGTDRRPHPRPPVLPVSPTRSPSLGPLGPPARPPPCAPSYVASLGELRYHLSTWHSRNRRRAPGAGLPTTGTTRSGWPRWCPRPPRPAPSYSRCRPSCPRRSPTSPGSSARSGCGWTASPTSVATRCRRHRPWTPSCGSR